MNVLQRRIYIFRCCEEVAQSWVFVESGVEAVKVTVVVVEAAAMAMMSDIQLFR